MNISEDDDKIEISTKDITKLVAILETLSNAAWVAAQELKMIAKVGKDVAKVQEMLFSPPKKKEPSKETQERVDAWLRENDF